MKAKTFDREFDEGKDITEALDLSKVRRVGVARQSIINMWLAERLEHSANNKSSNAGAVNGVS